MKKINVLILVNLCLALLFSFLNICFAADISCVAFLICAAYTAVLVYFAGFKFSKKKEYNKLFLFRKLFQYESFVFLIAFIFRRSGAKGTSYVFDLISVLCWLFIFITASILSFCSEFKRFKKMTGIEIPPVKNESLTKMFTKGKTNNGKKVTPLSYIKWFIFEVLDWGDALLQAVFLVLLFQIFFFQFYKIPSESMVPEYMIDDRVAVSKITSGPKFPLTDIGLPCFKEYKRGDIVVFRNPHYTINRQSEVKSIVSQLLYMFTFTFVNTNVDEDGNLIPDPLVKRITGVPGEQLMMQDGILYSRTKDSPEFKPVQEDARWACYNLDKESEALKRMMKRESLLISRYFENQELLESYRNEISISELVGQCKEISEEFNRLKKDGAEKDLTSDELISLFGSDFLHVENFWKEFQNGCDLSNRFLNEILSNPNGAAWFTAFMTDWIDNYEGLVKDGYIGGNLYEQSCFKLNLIYKRTLGKLICETYKNVMQDVPTNHWEQQPEIVQLKSDLHMLYVYMNFMDRRNMPVFPADDKFGNPQYIPEDCFFLMGDNRFNSLDMRHSLGVTNIKLTKFDNYSIVYSSSMNPQYVPKKLILGSAGVRFWPIGRPERASAK